MLPAPPALQLPDDVGDSDMARAIQASLDDARHQQGQAAAAAPGAAAAAGGSGSQPATTAAAGGEADAAAAGETGGATAGLDPSRPSDADIIKWENEIK